jgi:hypothetical protein
MNAKHVLALACAAYAAAGLAQGAVAAQSPGSDRFHPASAEQARASGIQMMARSFGISPAAAASRLNVEEHTPDIVERIRTQYANRLAGMYIEHAPTHRLVVRLTGHQPVQREFYQFGNDQLVVDYQVGAEHTFADLQKRFEHGFAGLKERLPTLQSGYVDERTGQLVLEVVNDQPKVANARPATASEREVASSARVAQQQLATNYFGVATRVASIGRIANQAIKGSGNLDATGVQCTGAFTVKSVSTPVTYGLLTAGHCQATTLNYTEVNTTTPITALSWVAAKNDAASDIGWASVSTNAADAVNSFYNGSIFVTTGTRITKAGTLIGSSMCHYGRSSISSASVCGTVQSTAYNPGSICGTSGTGACSATFVAVDVSTSTPCQQIDSGGNWYRVDHPAGVHKAADPMISGRCVYTSTDDIIGGMLNLQIL